MENCIFCKVINGELPKSLVFENDSVIAINSIQPVADTHILLIPKKHVGTFLDLDDQTILDLKNIARDVITEKNLDSGYKLVINGGKYQAVGHFHWHLLSGKFKDASDVLNKT